MNENQPWPESKPPITEAPYPRQLISEVASKIDYE